MSIIRPYKGSRVIRGPDWAHGNLDGGIGHIGTVVESDPESQMCSVLWDYGMLMENCQAGDKGIELRVIDTETSDFEHNLHTAHCDTCLKTGPTATKSISGFRWKCVECKDFDLCNLCYMQGKHDVNHRFMRYDNKLATVFPVPPRKRCKKLKVYSLMVDAQVRRSRKKGIDSDIGVIKKINRNDSTKDQEILVEWKSGETTTHLSGPKCKFDLVTAHHTVSIYLDHLPLADFNKIPDSWINVGDTIQIDLNIDTFKNLQKDFGGWNEQMEKIMGELGTVNSVESQKFLVYYTVSERSWFVCSNACAKVSIAEAGDKVKVLENQAIVKERQNRHGGWRENMKDILGKIGEVERVDSSGDLTVAFTYGIHLLNPSCCVKVMKSSKLPPKTTDPEPGMTAEVEEKTSDKSKMKTETQTGEMEEKQERDISNIAKGESAPRTATQETGLPVVEQQEKDKESLKEEDDDDDEDGLDFLQWLTQTDYEDMMEPGVRVVRGKDWKWGEQDGGEGNVGTVIDVGTQEDGTCPPRCAIVQWDSGYRNTYRAGFEDSFDLRIYDTATIGIQHPSLMCCVCEESGLMGFIWRCESNPNTILCNTCYHGDKYDVKLHFLRINKPGDTGVRVNKREMSKKVTAKGVFEGARVIRGPDWMWEDQDGNGMGKVISIVNFSLDTDRDAVEVTWDIGQTNVYRHGYDGKLDLKCTKPTTGGTYYRDQLPDLKINLATVTSPTASVSEAGSDRLNAGDSVRIGVDPEVLKAIHDSAQGMWNDSMIDCIGKIGEVVVQSGEDVTVKFDIGSWTFKEMALDKVKQLKKGETVRVRDNEQEVKELQNGHGNWNSQIQKTLGKKGKVVSIDRDGDVTVAFGPLTFQFNPAVLDTADGDPDVLALSDDKPPKTNPSTSAKLPSPSPAVTERPVKRQETKTTEQLLAELEEVVRDGYADRVRSLLEENINLRDMGTPPLIITACELGHTEVVKELVNFQCKLDVRNDKDKSNSDPLLTAVRKKHRDVVEVLLNAGIKKTVTNSHGQSAIHIAVQERDMQMLTLLQKHKLDINKKDSLGDSAITDAISTGDKRFIDMVVDWQGIQLNYFNRMSFSPLHFAASKGDNYAIRKIIQKDPSLVNIPKNDGFTALHLAACHDHVAIVKYLVGMPSVDREAKTTKGLTPLHVAAVHESVKTINLFLGLEDGIEPVSSNQPLVDVDSMDDMGNNALHLCLRGDDTDNQQSSEDSVKRQIEIALKLIHRGVKYNARNLDEKTPLEECTNEHVKERIRTALQEKDVRHKKQPAAPPSNMCVSCDEDQASYQLMPCHCNICAECGGRKAKKCPNCSREVEHRIKL